MSIRDVGGSRTKNKKLKTKLPLALGFTVAHKTFGLDLKISGVFLFDMHVSYVGFLANNTQSRKKARMKRERRKERAGVGCGVQTWTRKGTIKKGGTIDEERAEERGKEEGGREVEGRA